MRLARCVAMVPLVTLWFTPAILAQPDEQLDRTDLVAVAQAYVRACDAGDVEAAVALIADEQVRKGLRAMMESYSVDEEAGDGETSWLKAEFMQVQSLPVGIPLEREMADTTVEENTARVAFNVAYRLQQQLVLTKQDDGTWAVDLVESLKATAGEPETWLTEGLMYFGEEGDRSPSAEARLWRLLEAMQEYAADHSGELPPADTWVDEIELYVLDRSLFRNPEQPDVEYGFAMNIEAGGRGLPAGDLWDMGAEPEDFVVLFEWPIGQRNAAASVEELSRLNAEQPEDGGTAYITALATTGTLPAGMTWAEKGERDREEAAKWADERSTADTTYRCTTHLRALGQAARKYARDHGGLLPGAETWQDDLAIYLLEAGNEVGQGMPEAGTEADDVLRCPAAPDLRYGYAINVEIAGKNALDLTDHHKIILFFESDLNLPNAAGLPERDKVQEGRHEIDWHGEGPEGANQVVYLNGETGWLEWPEERWFGE